MTDALLELAVDALEDLVDEVVFVGAATLPLWITDTAAFQLRVTDDTDAVIEVTTKAEYDRFSERLRAKKMHEDSSSRIICRWRLNDSDLILDLMPSRQSILGFSGKWLERVPSSAVWRTLSSGVNVRVIAPVYLMATKLEAFEHRGRNDYFASKDFEDIVALLNGRLELVDEIRSADDELKRFVSAWFAQRLDDSQFLVGLEGALPGPGAFQRVESVILPRVREIAAIQQNPPR